ncbi:MAG: hypothetical protein GXO63_02505 [Candidatus Micrarchaeota archaeon]|nr:hypothetical protein [Candidatus Micrarchaeota archaeon]
MVKIIADYRECTDVLSELEKLGCEVTRKNLPVGDYVCSERVCVERKTFDDFLRSLIDGRLFEQARKLKEEFARPILVIEGPFLIERIHINAIFGALASLSVDYGIPIIRFSTPEETARFIFSVARREQIKDRKPVALRRLKPTSLTDQQLFLVSGLPDVNSVLASRLLTTFRTPREIFLASTKELRSVRGIGKSKAERIKKVLDTEYT